MQGQHSSIREPIKVEQVISENKIVKDFDRHYSSNEIRMKLEEELGSCTVHKEKVTVSLNGTTKYETVTYYTIQNLPCKLLVANITYLGKPHIHSKKRIQIPPKWRKFALVHKNEDIRFIGIYHYEDVCIFADFDKSGYITAESQNSSAHISVLDLKLALSKGKFFKTDHFGHNINVINSGKLREYFNGDLAVPTDLLVLFEEFNLDFPFNEEIGGIAAYNQMENDNFPYKNEMEWPGFYVEYLMSKFIKDHKLQDTIKYNGREDKNYEFDLYFPKDEFYGDIKTSGNSQKELFGNERNTTDRVIKKYNKLWYIVYTYDAERDINHNKEVAIWKAKKDGKPTDGDKVSYESKMKYSVRFTDMYIFQIDSNNSKDLLKECTVSGGREKYKMNKEAAKKDSIYKKS